MSGVGLGGGSWIGSGGGGGGVSNASNIGTAGVGPFDSLAAGVLQFKNINAASDKITVTDDLINKEIDIDVDETKLNVRNLTNVSPGGNGSFAGWSDLGVLSGVPGWTFDDIGTLKIGAQNSLTIPAGTTDYISVGISPSIVNAGMVNLAGVQLNSPIDQTVTSYGAFQAFGYGTSNPTNYVGYLSQPGYSGTGTNATHFLASGNFNTTTSIKAFDFSGGGNAANIDGLTIFPLGNSTNFQGVVVAPAGTHTNAIGFKVDFAGTTITNRPTGLDISGGTLSSTLIFSTTSSLPQLVDSGNIIRPIFEVQAGSPITGTDVLMSNLAGLMDIKDNHSGSVLGLGVASVGFISQVAVAATKTLNKTSMCLGALAIEASSGGGTVTDAQIFNAFAANFGGSLTITNLYGFRLEAGTSLNATNTWGLCIDDSGAENYLAKSLKIDGGSKKVSDSTIALEIGGLKSFRLGVFTTAQRLALPNIEGTMVFDTDTNKAYLNDGAGWHQFG